MNDIPENIEFNLLKSVSRIERFFTFLFFLVIYIGGLILISIISSFDEKYHKLYMIFFSFSLGYFLFYLERKRDKIVRRRIIGKIQIDLKHILFTPILGDEYILNIADINMLWVNYGLNTVTNKKQEYKFEDFETLTLRLINKDGGIITHHINNHANIPNGFIVSTYLEYLKKYHYFFQLHFHDQKSFSRKEYETTMKRYEIMKVSLKKRDTRRR
jgi:hypothetical protein